MGVDVTDGALGALEAGDVLELDRHRLAGGAGVHQQHRGLGAVVAQRLVEGLRRRRREGLEVVVRVGIDGGVGEQDSVLRLAERGAGVAEVGLRDRKRLPACTDSAPFAQRGQTLT